MNRLLAVLVFFICAEDADALYGPIMFAPLGWVRSILSAPLPIKIRPLDLLMGVLLVVASAKKPPKDVPKGTVRPMRSALLLAVFTVVVWFVLGIVRGGDVRAASWQIYLMLAAVLYAFAVAAIGRTVDTWILVAKAIVAAAMYRAIMCWVFYILYIRTLRVMPFPEYLTSHDDSVLWVIALVMLALNALERVTKNARLMAAICIPIIIMAIQFNTRRLAWVSLAAGLMAVYALLRPGPVKRRVNRYLLIAAPLVVLYVAVGWGRPERFFRPLHAFATVSTQEDASTKARNVENLGLIQTANSTSMFTGTGFGHRYIEVSSKYSIADLFELWPYIPHNSLLGLLAYTGMLGVAGWWLAFPTAMFLNARVARLASDKSERTIGIVAAAQMVICANQLYGDMGIFSPKTMYLLATSYAVALRLPIQTGVWASAPRRAKTLAPPAVVPPEPTPAPLA